MERISVRTTTCKTNHPGFLVDIVSDSKLYTAWLYHEEYGVKTFMFGLSKKDFTMQGFIETVENALDSENYIDQYREDYMDN